MMHGISVTSGNTVLRTCVSENLLNISVLEMLEGDVLPIAMMIITLRGFALTRPR